MAGRTVEFSRWATVDPPGGWSFLSGFFTQAARADLLAYGGDGSLWVGRNTGSGFSFAPWGRVQPAAGWQFVAGNFAGAGRTDLIGYHPSNGSLWLFENTGAALRPVEWGSVDPATDWQFATGSFTGRGKAEFFGYQPGDGSLWVGRNTGAGFDLAQWGRVTPAEGWQFVAGNFAGTGRTDVVGYRPEDGTLWVGTNATNRFRLRPWATVSPASQWQFTAGYFTSRARADLFGYHPGNGTLWVGENTGTGFDFWRRGAVDPASGWQFVVDVFDADLWADVVGYQPSNGSVWLGRSATHPIEGYCWPLSAAPGESISFMVSGEGPGLGVVSRLFSVGTTVTDVPVFTQTLDLTVQTVPANPWRTGCDWDETFGVTVPDAWPSGIYAASCADAHGSRTDITFVVKPAPERPAPSRLAVLANVNTWLAYNGWGGRSKYDGAARVSFLRPNPAAGRDGELHLTRAELWPLGWLEREGLRPDVFSDVDFHDGIDMAPYRCLLLTTHPEYWSVQMYDHLVAFLDGGGSLLYLGGNGLFEIGEYAADRSSMVFRNGVEDGPREDALFRVRPPTRPELALLGVATERCDAPGSPFEVLHSDHIAFAGTGLTDGDTFGAVGLNTGLGNGQASGWEIDTAAGPGATGIPCGLAARRVQATQPPADLVVLARGTFDGVGFGADMTYYDHPGGGFVFAAGSIPFCGSLAVDPVIQNIVRNLLLAAGVG